MLLAGLLSPQPGEAKRNEGFAVCIQSPVLKPDDSGMGVFGPFVAQSINAKGQHHETQVPLNRWVPVHRAFSGPGPQQEGGLQHQTETPAVESGEVCAAPRGSETPDVALLRAVRRSPALGPSAAHLRQPAPAFSPSQDSVRQASHLSLLLFKIFLCC